MVEGMPPWVRYFLIHVVKRMLCVLLDYINALQKAEKTD